MLARMSSKNSHLMLVGKKWHSDFGWQSGISWKLNILLLYNPAITLLGISLPKGLENLMSTQKSAHRCPKQLYFYNCENWEATKISFSRYMDKQTVVHPDPRILFSPEKKWAIKPWRHGDTSNAYYLSKKSQSEKATDCMIPNIWHSRKSKIMEILIRRDWCQELWGKGG